MIENPLCSYQFKCKNSIKNGWGCRYGVVRNWWKVCLGCRIGDGRRGERGQNKSTSLQLLESLKLSLIGIRIGKSGEKWKGGIGLISKLEKCRPLPHETQERQMHMENNDDTALYLWNCSLRQPQLIEIQGFFVVVVF